MLSVLAPIIAEKTKIEVTKGTFILYYQKIQL